MSSINSSSVNFKHSFLQNLLLFQIQQTKPALLPIQFDEDSATIFSSRKIQDNIMLRFNQNHIDIRSRLEAIVEG